MNKTLLDSIYNAIFKAISGTTTEIYFDFLPDESLLKKVTVVYELRNTSNSPTFDTKEANKFYQLTLKINSPTIDKLGNLSIYIKDQLNKLSTVSYISLTNEDLFYDPELRVWTSYNEFELQAN